MAPKSVPEASWERLRSVLGRPRRTPGAPGGVTKGTRGRQKCAQERPGARRGDQNRCQVASQSEKTENFLRKSVGKHRRSDFRMIFVRFMQKPCKCENRVLQQSGREKPGFLQSRPFARAVQQKLENRLENRPEILRKSSRIAPGSPSIGLFGRLLSLEAPRLSDSGRFGAPRGDQVDRSGSVGPPSRRARSPRG